MISVIGAGPAGCFYASKKQDVHLFEEHKIIGKPVACTGILTESINCIIDIKKDLIVSKINQFKLIAPNGKVLYIDLNKPNIVLDRAKFDQLLLEKAIDNGARLHNERFLGYRKIGKTYKIKTTKTAYETEMIVGADGPKSQVAQAAGIYNNRKFITGLQSRARFSQKLEQGVTEVRLNLGEFSWIVPEDDHIARVGIIGTDIPLLKKHHKTLLANSKILENQSGIIPLYNPKQILRKENVFLIGDAATQVKATTYGGIIYGLIASSCLAKDKENYVKNINKKIGRELQISLKIRKFINSMNNSQYNRLIDIFKKKHHKELLAKYNRDFPSKFITQLLIQEPGLWKLGFGILKNKILGK